uniref:Tetratricopeptide repeat-containing protein n=1 Tax=Candidatus Kentrum sp. MB TaxID=2138164 RepID=A0A450XF43_9GAMM|nr:MAG: Tetratricopeptide repeat-containing protein [Candidatus Kentron sp. MB]VFK74461.1 MAG: Tetratricopeptide repeat-containing protein [Candidatus Kentron sp. MB]
MITNSFRKNLEERFKDGVIPSWLLHFDQDSEAALHDLLRGRASLGHLSATEPDELLLDWLRGFGPRSYYARLLNDALTAWIDHHWGNPLLSDTGNAVLTSRAWLRTMDTIAASPFVGSEHIASPEDYPLFGAATLLRERVLADRHFLDDMTEAHTHDPQGIAWVALANHQTDRALLDEWWRLISLPPDEPWYRGKYGLMGLRRLPPENPALGGGFNKELAQGLGRLGEALWARTREGWLPEEEMRAEFSSIAHLTMGKNFPDRWHSYWRHLADQHRENDFVSWLPISEAELHQPRHGNPSRIEPDAYSWMKSIKNLTGALIQPTEEVIKQAERLLDEQRHYANATGNMSFLVRTACNFSGHIRVANPQQALAWARMAKGINPWDAHTWTNEAMALVVMEDYAQALGVYSEAILRFPENAVARNGRAEVLKLQGKLDEALAAYEETIDRFPENVVARTGRAEVLKLQEKLEDALAAYEETIDRFPENVVARTGRAEVLKLQGRLDDALAAYEETIDRFPEDVVARNGREGVLRARQGLTDISRHSPWQNAARVERPALDSSKETDGGATSMEVPALNRDEVNLLITDAYLIRRWARQGKENDPWLNTGMQRERARDLLDRLLTERDRNSLAAGESGILSLATGDSMDRQRALDFLRAAVKRFPGSPRVRYALDRAEREEAMAKGDASVMPMLWKKLIRLDRHLFPLQWMGPLLLFARVSLSDQVWQEHAEQLAIWLFPRLQQAKESEPSFYAWWGSAVYGLLFGTAVVRDASELPDMETMRENLRVNYKALVIKEEELLYRHARR